MKNALTIKRPAFGKLFALLFLLLFSFTAGINILAEKEVCVTSTTEIKNAVFDHQFSQSLLDLNESEPEDEFCVIFFEDASSSLANKLNRLQSHHINFCLRLIQLPPEQQNSTLDTAA